MGGKPGCELLIHAIDESPNEIVQALIQSGVDIEGRDDLERTPLHMALYKRRNDIAHQLISMGVFINPIDNFGNTPLYYAVLFSNEEMISVLYALGGTIPYPDKHIEV
jgi:ankyrin repeat protein